MSTTALSNLVANYKSRVDALTDTDTKLEALWCLETFQGAAGAYESSTGRGPVQYSIAGRSFSFPSKLEAKRAMDDAKSDLFSYLGSDGGTTKVDFGGTIW